MPQLWFVLWVPSRIYISFWTNIFIRSHNFLTISWVPLHSSFIHRPASEMYTDGSWNWPQLIWDWECCWYWPTTSQNRISEVVWKSSYFAFSHLLGQNLFWRFSFPLFVVCILELSCLLLWTMSTLYSFFVVLACIISAEETLHVLCIWVLHLVYLWYHMNFVTGFNKHQTALLNPSCICVNVA